MRTALLAGSLALLLAACGDPGGGTTSGFDSGADLVDPGPGSTDSPPPTANTTRATTTNSSEATTTTTTDPGPGPPFDSWTVIVASLPVEEFTSAEALALLQEMDPPDGGVLLSSDYPSLNPGYWVVYSGIFDVDGRASEHCASLPFDCYHRYLGKAGGGGNGKNGNDLEALAGVFDAWMGGGSSTSCGDDLYGPEPPYFGPLSPASLGSVITFCALGFEARSIDVEIEFPDGSVGSFQMLPYQDRSNDVLANPLKGDDLISPGESYFWFVPSETPRGTYVFTARQSDFSLTTEIEMTLIPGPWIETIAGRAEVGQTLVMALSGLPPNTLIPLGLYQNTGPWPGGTFRLYEELEPVRTDDNGAALVRLSFDPSYYTPPEEGVPKTVNTFCVTGPHFAIDKTRAGVGWTVCDAEAGAGLFDLEP